MPVSYTKADREAASDGGLYLVTVAAGGLVYQGGVTEEIRDQLVRLILDLGEARRKAEKPAEGKS